MQIDVLKLKLAGFFNEVIPSALRQFREYGKLMRIDRPIGVWLLGWGAMWALWIAGEGRPDPKVFTVFVLGVFLMRSAGCVINDFADRKFDPHVRKSRHRPIAAGRVSKTEALILFAGLCLIAFGLVLTLNALTVKLAFVGIFLAITYPFLKRFTPLPQFYLGITFGWAVPMAFAAQTGEIPQLAWLIFLATTLWAVVYDTMYAMVDREDDLKLGLKSTAILFGDSDRLIVGVLQLMLLASLVLVGRQAGLSAWYYAGVAVAGCMSLYQQYLIRNREPDACFRAFLNNHPFGAAVFAGIVLHYTFTTV